MKKIMIIFMMFLVVACSNTDLPPEPGAPGGITVGQASASLSEVDSNYVVPDNKLTLSSDELEFLVSGGNLPLVTEIDYDAFVWKDGYILKNGAWEKFSFDEDDYKETNWIIGTASKTLILSKQDFPEDEHYVIAYACKKNDAGWDCNDGKWMLYPFEVVHEIATPSTPSLPGQIVSLTSFASINNKLSLSSTQLEFLVSGADLNLDLEVNDEFILNYGYIQKNNVWEKFNFDESAYKSTNWIFNKVNKRLTLSKSDYSEGEYPVLVYSCNGLTDCNSNKWKMQKINVIHEIATPVSPSNPTSGVVTGRSRRGTSTGGTVVGRSRAK